MINLDNITLVCVTSVRIEQSIKALKYSSKDIKFADVKLITHKDIDVSGITVEKCPKLDYKDYSEYVIYNLYKHINTDFVLVINWDGFIINPHKWNDNFLKYDYIGALWTHEHKFFDIKGNESLVGNGGFSLRSKKLLETANKLNIPFEPRIEKKENFFHEDALICVKNKHLYEKNGCKFAPKKLASEFSTEQGKKPNLDSFGCHGKFYYNQFKHLIDDNI